MRQFFKPCRRKIGFVTLLMAMAFSNAWIRSMSVCDLILVPLGNHIFEELGSSNSVLVWKHVRAFGTLDTRVSWKVTPRTARPESWFGDIDRLTWTKWIFRWRDFKIGKGVWMTGGRPDIPPVTFIALPYWSIVTPLTLLSVW